MCFVASLPNIDGLFDNDAVEVVDQKETSESEEDVEKDWLDDSILPVQLGIASCPIHVIQKEQAINYLLNDVWSPPPEIA